MNGLQNILGLCTECCRSLQWSHCGKHSSRGTVQWGAASSRWFSLLSLVQPPLAGSASSRWFSLLSLVQPPLAGSASSRWFSLLSLVQPHVPLGKHRKALQPQLLVFGQEVSIAVEVPFCSYSVHFVGTLPCEHHNHLGSNRQDGHIMAGSYSSSCYTRCNDR